MLKRLLLLVALVFWPCYSYSDNISPYYGTTPNATINGYNWSMNNVLPEPPGLDINGVFYSYTPQKLTEDDFKVTVGNKAANGGNDIWNDTEDWSGHPGGIEVRKVIGLPNVPRELWGDGYIETQGTGTVEDATVVYSYKVDPCYDPQFSPSCPGYVTPMPVIVEVKIEDLYDATEDEAVASATEEKETDVYEEEKTAKNEDEEEEEERKEMRLEAALSAVDNSEMFAQSFAQAQILAQINAAVNISNYVSATIPGGTYKEDVVLLDRKIEDNQQGLRNGLAQQLLHEKMIEMQYTN